MVLQEYFSLEYFNNKLYDDLHNKLYHDLHNKLYHDLYNVSNIQHIFNKDKRLKTGDFIYSPNKSYYITIDNYNIISMTNNKNVIHNKNKYVEIFINYKNKLVITAPPIHPFTVIKPLYLESINNVELLELLDDGNIKIVYYIRDKYNNIIDHKINIYSSLNQIFNM